MKTSWPTVFVGGYQDEGQFLVKVNKVIENNLNYSRR